MEIDSALGKSRLTVSDVVLEDKGSWTCTASNAAGSDQIDFEIEVWQPPESTKKNSNSEKSENKTESDIENVTGILSSSMNLHCEVSAYPPPEITWFHNGQEIFENDAHYSLSSNKQILTIQSAKSDDSGDWRCLAKNQAGSLTSKVYSYTVYS